jgi:hypothetical protein
MVFHPFFDVPIYPWARPDAQDMHRTLSRFIKQSIDIELHYEASGGTTPLTPQLAPHRAWKEVLDLLATAKVLPRLCDRILADQQLVAAHPAVQAVCDAKDLATEIVLPQEILFLDRKNLRNELETLSQPSASRALLVRGPSGAGKSWTEELIKTVAADRGVSNVYLYEGTVSVVRDVVDELFTALGDSSKVPPVDETDPAWYRRVCLKLQELASQRKVFLWVVADDLGEYEGGPRLDREIRAFFNQFALHMANPAFAQWFRLILIDYPDGPVPTKWRAWSEDRPDENEVDQVVIAEYLIAWAKTKQKNLGVDRAGELAKDILAKVGSPPAPTDPDPRRLARINAELKAVLKTL